MCGKLSPAPRPALPLPIQLDPQKQHGSRKLVEAPETRLREIQRRQLIEKSCRPVPTIHRARRAGFSARDAVLPDLRGAAHPGARSCFEWTFASSSQASGPANPRTLRHARLSGAVARIAGLCTNNVPIASRKQGALSWTQAKHLAIPHLPPGAATSRRPSQTFITAFRPSHRRGLASALEARLHGYADDIAISGGETNCTSVDRLPQLVARIAIEEGESSTILRRARDVRQPSPDPHRHRRQLEGEHSRPESSIS